MLTKTFREGINLCREILTKEEQGIDQIIRIEEGEIKVGKNKLKYSTQLITKVGINIDLPNKGEK